MTYLTTHQFIEQLQHQTAYHVYRVAETQSKLLLQKDVIGHPHRFIYDIGAQRFTVYDDKGQAWHAVFDNFNDIDDMTLLTLLAQYLPNNMKGNVPNNLPTINVKEG